MALHDLEAGFAGAQLPLSVFDVPLDRSGGRNGEVVQMDIAREQKRRERFRLNPGAGENRVEVTTLDRRERQLVLLVHEPRRPYEAAVGLDERLAPGTVVVREDARRRTIRSGSTERRAMGRAVRIA